MSDFGTPITTLAIQVTVVTTLSGSAADVGLINAARWLPYRPAMWLCIGGVAAAGLALLASPLRTVR